MPTSLLGDWCYEKKRKITRYRVLEAKLNISGGRSGRIDELDLSCNEDFTLCESKSVRGWGTPVTEILRLDGETMQLTRVWEGSWKGKTYDFTYTRCPKF